MTNQELYEHQQLLKRWRETELGSLFERFVNLHAKAWQLDERSSHGYGEKTADRAWKELDPVEKQLRGMLMKIVGVEE